MSLFSQKSDLISPEVQRKTLSSSTRTIAKLDRFEAKLRESNLYPLSRTGLEVFQVNVGKMCNQTCKHCHVDAGPDRKEIMTKETMELCLKAIDSCAVKTVDLTGGAPELNPNFRWFVEAIREKGVKVMVRCNLTILVANSDFAEIPEFYAREKVHVVSSLPCYKKENTDSQRGDGVFNRSIEALRKLNKVGYGKEGSGLLLDLVYNPTGPFLPPAQKDLENLFRSELKRYFGIEFNQLYTITNMPISRFLESLLQTGNLEEYMEKLVTSFNPVAAKGVMCRNTVSISWDGYLYDCDFNQMLDMKFKDESGKPIHLSDWKPAATQDNPIQFDQHCFGCTAGLGSSCGGTTS